ncbi:hypothetical protein B484DRAFT_39330 [Ochromonadaceae sp. CCMP2298]|nr:hypothetical protein B484DRAFT_39330 [Ochromonadaceae sp. CCMP2298]
MRIKPRVNVTLPGNIFCAALPRNTPLTSALTIRNTGVSAFVAQAYTFASLTVADLGPDTAYDAYCYTEDLTMPVHTMPLGLVLQSKQSVTTECCRTIFLESPLSSIIQYFPSSVESPFSFALDAPPTHALAAAFSIQSVKCSPTQVPPP